VIDPNLAIFDDVTANPVEYVEFSANCVTADDTPARLLSTYW
jgi:hypothetical protein